MPRWDFLPELPAAYEVVEGRRGVLACRAGWSDPLASAGLGPDDTAAHVSTVEASTVAAPHGRRPVELLRLNDTELVVRRFTHGGLFRWLSRDRFGDPRRPFDELVLSAQLAERGIPTPEVVAARAQRAGAFGWRLCLVTSRIEDALDGAEVMRQVADGALGTAERHLAVQTAGDFVGRLHAAGLWHADLTPNNLLLGSELRAGEPPRCWVLDLDRSRLAATLGDDERAGNLERFLRSVAKRQLTIASELGLGDAARFLRAYAIALDRPAAAWREDWRALSRLERRGRLAHRASWLLETLFAGGGPNRRAAG